MDCSRCNNPGTLWAEGELTGYFFPENPEIGCAAIECVKCNKLRFIPVSPSLLTLISTKHRVFVWRESMGKLYQKALNEALGALANYPENLRQRDILIVQLSNILWEEG